MKIGNQLNPAELELRYFMVESNEINLWKLIRREITKVSLTT